MIKKSHANKQSFRPSRPISGSNITFFQENRDLQPQRCVAPQSVIYPQIPLPRAVSAAGSVGATGPSISPKSRFFDFWPSPGRAPKMGPKKLHLRESKFLENEGLNQKFVGYDLRASPCAHFDAGLRKIGHQPGPAGRPGRPGGEFQAWEVVCRAQGGLLTPYGGSKRPKRRARLVLRGLKRWRCGMRDMGPALCRNGLQRHFLSGYCCWPTGFRVLAVPIYIYINDSAFTLTIRFPLRVLDGIFE